MERRPIFVYSLSGPPADLQSQAAALGQPLYHWVADAVVFHIGEGVPQEWRETGAIFGPCGELRWWREESGYRALLFTEMPVSGLTPLPGKWEGEEHTFFLQSLDDRRLHASFSVYPRMGREGRWKGIVLYRDGVAIFLSPRALVPGKGGNL